MDLAPTIIIWFSTELIVVVVPFEIIPESFAGILKLPAHLQHTPTL
jgi:hypothetical protein